MRNAMKIFSFSFFGKAVIVILAYSFLVFVYRAWLFENNKCPDCIDILYLYTPTDYYTPVYIDRKVRVTTDLVYEFNFTVDKYGRYRIALENRVEEKGRYALTGDVDYTLLCMGKRDLRTEMEKLEKLEKFLKLPELTELHESKEFFAKERILRLAGLSESKKDDAIRYFFTNNGIRFGVVPAFDTGGTAAGEFGSDIGREYFCKINFKMAPGDYFIGDMVVQRADIV
jgi:hypothetical protein